MAVSGLKTGMHDVASHLEANASHSAKEVTATAELDAGKKTENTASHTPSSTATDSNNILAHQPGAGGLRNKLMAMLPKNMGAVTNTLSNAAQTVDSFTGGALSSAVQNAGNLASSTQSTATNTFSKVTGAIGEGASKLSNFSGMVSEATRVLGLEADATGIGIEAGAVLEGVSLAAKGVSELAAGVGGLASSVSEGVSGHLGDAAKTMMGSLIR